MLSDDDQILWDQLREGDEQAFAGIYQKYFKSLYNYASKLTVDKDLVKDCLHDLFIELWDRRQRLPAMTSIKFYLFKAVRYTVLDRLTSHSRKVVDWESYPEAHFDFVLPYESDLIARQLSQEQQQRLQAALTSLTERQKEAIFLRFYGNFSYEQIASMMSLSVDSTYNLVSRALAFLRKQLVQLGMFALLSHLCILWP
jgi:RNA polymerase sigma factor (sigma-70 family)